MTSDYHIHLNFLPVAADLPAFRVFTRAHAPDDIRPSDDTMLYSLPVSADPQDRATFWVKLSPGDGFAERYVQPDDNRHLTRRVLYLGLRSAATRLLQPNQFRVPKQEFVEELDFVMAEHPEGHELLTVQPYYLRVAEQFGCLVDFRFWLGENVPHSRRVQQLSLSLDKNFRRNLDCYLDRLAKITDFLERRRELFATLSFPGTDHTVAIRPDFVPIPARRLRTKVYLCGGGRDARSQFMGLRQNGPLDALVSKPTLLFAFRERDRQAARLLALALKGSNQRDRYGFPGFGAIFKTELILDANPIVLPDLSKAAFLAALDRVRSDRASKPCTLPIFVLPEGDDNGYLEHKAAFAHEGIPTQVCTLPVIQDENALKWAIANIALQVFCKAGGQPWKVRPTPEATLIVGISQSHKIRATTSGSSVEKYFAFSVMTDNSGLFQKLQVLGDAGTQADYLAQLRSNLRQILDEGSRKFSRVVVHTSFRLKKREMDAIQRTVAQAAEEQQDGHCHFAVVKVNHRSRFFGVNRAVNSLVPYEATTVRLGGGEHLIWFEGIFPDKPTVNKAYPGPTHIEFLRVSEDNKINDDVLLQDLVNLSGANWRGFNAKSAPVSVFYCHLVADLVHDFHELGLPLPKVQDIRPWFL